MAFAISLEVTVPPEVLPKEIIDLGQRVCTTGDTEGMTVEEALAWCFGDPGAVMGLSLIGVTWESIHHGGKDSVEA